MVYSTEWFIYMLVSFALIIGINILLYFTVKKESTKETLIKVFALLTFFAHISIYYYNFIFLKKNDPGSDSTFIPIYPCNVCMMLFPLVYLFNGKTRQFLITFLAYYGFFGGVITTFEPSSFYSGTNILEWGSFKAFLSHSLLLMTSVYCFTSGNVKIGIKNVLTFIEGLFFVFLPIGLIVNWAFKGADPTVNAMYLRSLPLTGVPLLSAYFICFLMVVVIIIFITIWDRFKKPESERWYNQLKTIMVKKLEKKTA